MYNDHGRICSRSLKLIINSFLNSYGKSRQLAIIEASIYLLRYPDNKLFYPKYSLRTINQSCCLFSGWQWVKLVWAYLVLNLGTSSIGSLARSYEPSRSGPQTRVSGSLYIYLKCNCIFRSHYKSRMNFIIN